MLDSKIDAIIIFDDLGNPQIATLTLAGIPVVVIGATKNKKVPVYYSNPEEGFFRLAEHLLERGNSQLTFLSTQVGNDPAVPWYVQSATDGIERAAKIFRARGQLVSARIHTQHISFEGLMVKDAPTIHGLHAGGYLGMKAIIRQSSDTPDSIQLAARGTKSRVPGH